MPELPLEDRVAIVTGSGRGLGKALAFALAEAGSNVVLAARTFEEIGAAASEIGRLGVKALAIATDVTRSEDVQNLVSRSMREFGRIDILCNNAGTFAGKPLLDLTEDDWERVVATNLTSMFLCSQAVGKEMIKRKSGRIINISSVRGIQGASPALGLYCSTKAAIIQFTKYLALEWLPYNIKVNAVLPGNLNTELTALFMADEQVKRALMATIPLGRLIEPKEMGRVAVYLASDDSDCVTGEAVLLDGGVLARHPAATF
jgi:NAD(P)-dependent dehydrogenase (short-subunit alcohol dehydrogenase family)